MVRNCTGWYTEQRCVAPLSTRLLLFGRSDHQPLPPPTTDRKHGRPDCFPGCFPDSRRAIAGSPHHRALPRGRALQPGLLLWRPRGKLHARQAHIQRPCALLSLCLTFLSHLYRSRSACATTRSTTPCKQPVTPPRATRPLFCVHCSILTRLLLLFAGPSTSLVRPDQTAHMFIPCFHLPFHV